MGTALCASEQGGCVTCADECVMAEKSLQPRRMVGLPLMPRAHPGRVRALGFNETDPGTACGQSRRAANLGVDPDDEFSDSTRRAHAKSVMCEWALPSTSRCMGTNAGASLEANEDGVAFLDCEQLSHDVAQAPAVSYEGETSPGGSRHGWGTCTFADGSRYCGEWRHSEQHGIGDFLGSSRAQHCGQYVSGQRHGYGVALFQTGDRYEGNFEKGQITGRGARFFSNGDACCGDFVGGKLQGQATFFWCSGECYDGSVAGGQRQKVGGVLFHENGDVDVDLLEGESVGWSGDRARFWHSSGVHMASNGDFDEVAEACWRLGGVSRERLLDAFAGPPERPVPNTHILLRDDTCQFSRWSLLDSFGDRLSEQK